MMLLSCSAALLLPSLRTELPLKSSHSQQSILMSLKKPSFVEQAAELVGPSVARIAIDGREGSGCIVEQGNERFLATSSLVAAGSPGSSLSIAIADGVHEATIVSVTPEDIVLLSLPHDEALPKAVSLEYSAVSSASEGDFVIAVNGDGDASLGILESHAFAVPSVADAVETVNSDLKDGAKGGAERTADGGAEGTSSGASMADEQDWVSEYGTAHPYLVVQAPLGAAMAGAPLIDADGRLAGLTLSVFAAGGECRYYAASASAVRRAVAHAQAAAARGEKREGWRVVLLNDPFNKREKVQQVLCDAGLSASAANLAMLSAHKSGRGTVGFFKADEADEAQALVSALEDRGLLVRSEAWEYYADDANDADGTDGTPDGQREDACGV